MKQPGERRIRKPDDASSTIAIDKNARLCGPRKRQRSQPKERGFNLRSHAFMGAFISLCVPSIGDARELSQLDHHQSQESQVLGSASILTQYSEADDVPQPFPVQMPKPATRSTVKNYLFASPNLEEIGPKDGFDMLQQDHHYFSGLNSRELQTEQQCRLAMAVRDTDRDDQLSQEEYVIFLNQLTSNAYTDTPFQSLPCPLRLTFDTYAAGTSTIDVTGTKPGQTPTAEQDERISGVCTDVIGYVPGPNDDEGCAGAPVIVDNIDCSGTIQRPQCNTALSIADLTRDDQMDQSEYVRFVNRLSSNAYPGDSYVDLPGNLQANFEKFATGSLIGITGSKPGQNPTRDQDVFLNALCCETDLAIDNPGQPVAPPTRPPAEAPTGDDLDCSGTISEVQCNTALSIADSSRDDLLSQTEYVRFINRLSSNEYIGSDYTELPASLQSNFVKYATSNGQVDVTGSKPGQTPTRDQGDSLAAFCCETDLIVDDPTSPVGPTEPTPPSEAPPTETLPPTFLPTFCRTAMASSDFNRDDSLNQEEYVRYLNRLTDNFYSGLQFTELDESLRRNFFDNSQDGEIDIFGSKPGQSPSNEQSQFLQDFCVDTAVALDESSGGPGPTPTLPPAGVGPTAAPASAPQGGGPSPPPTFIDVLCRTAMASSDSNRDDYLNQEEYVRFLNRLTQNQFGDDTFETLDQPLSQTYVKLSDDTGEIWIFGSKPGQDASEEQEALILEICLEISIALDQLGGPIAPVSGPPAQPTPTLPPGIAEVFSSFVISNTRGLTAEELENGQNRNGLDATYGAFAADAVNTIAQSRRLLQASPLRGRRLAVTYVDGSDEIYLILADNCPEGTEAVETCQTAFAKYQVSLDQENPEEISEQYTEASQTLISEGVLQDILAEKDPRSSLRIVGSSSPVTSTFPPTPAPDTNPPVVAPTPNGGGGDGGSSIGAIVGGIFGGILFCALIGWASTKFGSGRGKVTDDDDNFGGGKDDDASDGEKDNDFGLGGDKDDSAKGSVGNDNMFGEKEKDPQDTKKVFGFGKKNKQASGKGDAAFGNDPVDTNNTFGNEGEDNLELFAFDEPSIGHDNGENQDGGSVAAKDNAAFGAPDSPGWGNANDGGGGFFGGDGNGWGASGNEKPNSDNFFGASGFAEEEANEEGSRSQTGSEEGSYTSSEDGTYESGNADEEEDEESGSHSHSSADEESTSQSGSMSSRLRRKSEQLDGMIDDGNWDGIAAAASSFDGSSLEGSSKRSSDKDFKDKPLKDSSVETDEGEEEGSFSESEESGSASQTTATTSPEESEKREEFRAQVDALVHLVLPDEVEKIDAMMEQFKGREAELVSTLQTMQERSATQRARAAVHKSKNRPQRGDGRPDAAFSMASGGGGTEGSAAGTAAIAAASLPIPAAGMFEGESEFGDDQGFGGQDAFGASGDMEESYEDEEEGSYYDEEEVSRPSGSGSRSYYSDEGSGTRSGSQSGSRSGSGSRSYYSDEEGSFIDDGDGTYDEEGTMDEEGTRSRGSQSGSRSGSQSGSRSHYSGEGSQGSRSHYSGEGSQGSRSYYSGEGSQRSGSQRSGSQRTGSQRSGSQHSGSQQSGSQRSGSQYSGEEGSHFTGDEEGAHGQHSGEEDGSQSHYSGEEGSRGNQSQSQGSRSFVSGEEEGSFISGEEGEEGSFAGEGEGDEGGSWE